MSKLTPNIIFNNGSLKVLEFVGTPNDYVDFKYRTVFTPPPTDGIGIVMSGAWTTGPFPDIPNNYTIERVGFSDHIVMNLYNPPGKPVGARSRRCFESGIYVCVKPVGDILYDSRRIESHTGNIITTHTNNLIVMPIGSVTIDGVVHLAPAIISIAASKNIVVTSESVIIEFWTL